MRGIVASMAAPKPKAAASPQPSVQPVTAPTFAACAFDAQVEELVASLMPTAASTEACGGGPPAACEQRRASGRVAVGRAPERLPSCERGLEWRPKGRPGRGARHFVIVAGLERACLASARQRPIL